MHTNDRQLKSWQRWSLLAAVAAIVVSALLSWESPDRVWRAYLFGYLACWLVTMGGMGLLAIGNLTGGRWAAAARPVYLAEMYTLPLVAILFIPIALSLSDIYPWAMEGTHLDLQPSKAAWLSKNFFLARAVGYFVAWLLVAGLLTAVSKLHQLPGSTPAMRRVGALSLVLLAPTVTFAAFDWGMSLEPLWYSSIYGAILTASGVLAAHALAILALGRTRTFGKRALVEMLDESQDEEPPTYVAEQSAPPHPGGTQREESAANVFNDLGNLLLAFVMVFTYFSFSQFLIIWSGNLPHEIVWYQRRLSGGWQWLALVIVVLMFFVPFLNLLSRDLKRSTLRLPTIASLLVVMHCVHLYWVIVPAFSDTGVAWQLSNVAALVVLAGAWLAAALWHANRIEASLPEVPANHSES